MKHERMPHFEASSRVVLLCLIFTLCLVYSIKKCNFANAYESKVSRIALRKVLFTEFAKVLNQEDGAFLLSLGVYARYNSIRHRREICSIETVPDKVFGDTW